ncbi:MarR family winged helix-turn-helix transcriptional regulator [Rhodovulum sp. DZ06]|uniref:MarR family winged helix-turn-helix transcriptional regulator n=1 Tax=Rhodovulum sp. DZ06 TaxID=3425126 RepID=UPI003D34ED86
MKAKPGALDDALFLVDAPDPEGEAGAARRTLSLTEAPSVLLVFAANRYTRTISRIYQARYGIGAMDWRMLVTLTRTPDSSVSQAADLIGIDKAAVSRAIARLEARGLVQSRTPGPDARRRLFRLTAEGAALHDEVLVDALRLQREMLDGFSEEEAATLAGLLRRFIDNLDDAGDAG